MNGKKSNGIINKLVLFTTSAFISFTTTQIGLMPSALAAQKTVDTSQASNSSSLVNQNSDQTLLAQYLCRSYRVTRPNGLYVYHGRRVVATIYYNTIVRVTQVSRNGKWALVYYRGGSGWVARGYLGCYQR